jgi:hypothetical protein
MRKDAFGQERTHGPPKRLLVIGARATSHEPPPVLWALCDEPLETERVGCFGRRVTQELRAPLLLDGLTDLAGRPTQRGQ